MSPLRLLLPLWRRYRGRYLLGFGCVAVAVLLRLLVPWLLGDSVEALERHGSVRKAEQAGVGVLDAVVRGALLVAATAALGAVVRTTSRILLLGTGRRVVRDLRSRLFDHLLRLPPSFYGRRSTGDLMSRAVNDVQHVQGLSGPVLLYLAETGLLYLIGIAFMASVSVPLTVIGMLPFPFVLWRARRLAMHVQTGSRAAQEQLARVSTKVSESLNGHMIIRSLAVEDFDRGLFAAQANAYRERQLEVARVRATLFMWMTGLASASTLAVFAYGGWRVVQGAMSLGDFVSMFFWLQMLAAPTGALGFVISSAQRARASLARLGELFDEPVTLGDRTGLPERRVRGDLEVRDLSVVMRNDRGEPRTVLDRVSLKVPEGRTVGVLGHTGSGKSVLLSVLARQLEVPAGSCFVDGIEVHDWRLEDLRAGIGVVPQEAFLFSDDLHANVALGRPDATEEEVREALRIADLEKDLDQFPGGLRTMVGERGLTVSGGQRQRVALARVLLADPRVLLLDDPFSAMDADTTDRILERIRPRFAGRTVVLVAHRVATVQHADEIVVMEEGRIVERGAHAELLRRDGAYAALHRRQQAREDLIEGLEEEVES